MEDSVVEKIIEDLKGKRDLIEKNQKEFAMKNLKLILIDVIDSLIFAYEIMDNLPKEIKKYIETASNEFLNKAKNLKKNIDEYANLYC